MREITKTKRCRSACVYSNEDEVLCHGGAEHLGVHWADITVDVFDDVSTGKSRDRVVAHITWQKG